jgi:hypothetical protein
MLAYLNFTGKKVLTESCTQRLHPSNTIILIEEAFMFLREKLPQPTCGIEKTHNAKGGARLVFSKN